ncbi:hypothetical protein TrRE_jg13501, partial [Triparma retinervis]
MNAMDTEGRKPHPNTPQKPSAQKVGNIAVSLPAGAVLGSAFNTPPRSPGGTRRSSLSLVLENTGQTMKRGYTYISSFWFIVTLVTMLSFAFTLFAIVYLNYAEFQHPGSGQELVGTSVNHALTIHSVNNPSELRFLTGFDRQNTFGMRVDEDGVFDMFRVAEDEGGVFPAVTLETSGNLVVREEFTSRKTVSAPRLKSTSEGVIFPDGSVMTTAADTAVGVKSETDLNIIAGANQSMRDASIIMTVGTKERMR